MSKSFEETLAKLQAKFAVQLREMLPTVEGYLAAYQAHQITPQERGAMAALAHRLAGGGSTFGFDHISETAAAVEDAFEHGLPQDEGLGLSLLTALVKEMHRIVDALPASGDLSSTASKENQKSKLLIADDDTLLQELIVQLFADQEVTILCASQGEEALAVARKHQPDLVLLDVNMPKMTGMEVLQLLKADAKTATIPVIMLTRKDTDESIMQGILGGALDYMTKPFDVAELSRRVMNVLERKNTRILVADDDPLVRSLLNKKFTALGYTVVQAEQGQEALEIAAAIRPDAVILDIMMPVLDGFSVLQQMKQNPYLADIPIVILSVKNQQENVLKGLEGGAHDYIVKPFDVDEVAARVTGILLRHKRS